MNRRQKVLESKELPITQSELRSAKCLKQAADQYYYLKYDLIARLEAGAEVEAGLLTVTVETERHCNSSWDQLREIFGNEAVEQARAVTVPYMRKTLRVEEKAPAKVDKAPAPQKENPRPQSGRRSATAKAKGKRQALAHGDVGEEGCKG